MKLERWEYLPLRISPQIVHKSLNKKYPTSRLTAIDPSRRNFRHLRQAHQLTLTYP